MYYTLSFTPEQYQNMLEWAGRLETTPLKQTTGRLRSGFDGYCCLGVYVDYAHPDTWIQRPDDVLQYWRATDLDHTTGYLPRSFQTELGLDQRSHTSRGMQYTVHDVFIHLNDTLHFSFPRIAAEIRYILQHKAFCPEVQNTLEGKFI